MLVSQTQDCGRDFIYLEGYILSAFSLQLCSSAQTPTLPPWFAKPAFVNKSASTEGVGAETQVLVLVLPPTCLRISTTFMSLSAIIFFSLKQGSNPCFKGNKDYLSITTPTFLERGKCIAEAQEKVRE